MAIMYYHGITVSRGILTYPCNTRIFPAMKKPPEKARTAPVSFRVDPDKRDRWKEAAKADGRTLKAWMERILDRAAARREK